MGAAQKPRDPRMTDNTGRECQRDGMGVRAHSNSIESRPKSSVSSVSSGFTLAIDIGRTGALALFDTVGRLIEVADIPVLEDGPAARPTINGPLLATIVRRWAPTCAVVEHVAARPGEAPSGAFAFGRSRGVIEGVLAAQGVPIVFRTPAWWKRRVGIPAGRDMKDMARSQAIARWPDRADLFARKLDHDRAEACLIGVAHLSNLQP